MNETGTFLHAATCGARTRKFARRRCGFYMERDSMNKHERTSEPVCKFGQGQYERRMNTDAAATAGIITIVATCIVIAATVIFMTMRILGKA